MKSERASAGPEARGTPDTFQLCRLFTNAQSNVVGR